MTEPDDPIPGNFQAWRHCIEYWCGIPLTREFIEQRLEALAQPEQEHTRRFIECYGQVHYDRVYTWFRQALAELE